MIGAYPCGCTFFKLETVGVERRSGLNGGSQREAPSEAAISTYLYIECIASRMVTIGSELKG